MLKLFLIFQKLIIAEIKTINYGILKKAEIVLKKYIIKFFHLQGNNFKSKLTLYLEKNIFVNNTILKNYII